MIMNPFKRIALWATMKYMALAMIAFVFATIAAEAYDVKQAVTWVSEKITKLVWNAPNDNSHHYRVEITKTDLLQEPVTSYVSHNYVQSNDFQVELADNCSYAFRIQSMSELGALSGYSEISPLYVYRKSDAAKQASSAGDTPQEFSLSQNYPNPFNGQTTIKYFIPNAAGGDKIGVQLIIFNTLGQKVKTLVNGALPPGNQMQIWDGRNDAGQEVSSGHYMYQLVAGNYRASKKMLYMK